MSVRTLIPLIAGITVVVMTLELGNWQIRRAGEKAALQASYDVGSEEPATLSPGAQPPEWQRVQLRGSWLAQHSVLIDNRVHRGQAGYHVVTPLRVAGGGVVLVNRGWIAAGPRRDVVPHFGTPGGEVVVGGRVRYPEAEPFALGGTQDEGPVWQTLDRERFAARLRQPVAAYVVQQTDAAADGLVRDWPAPDAGIERHRGYAFQWYALAALAAGLTGWYAYRGWRKRQHGERNPD